MRSFRSIPIKMPWRWPLVSRLFNFNGPRTHGYAECPARGGQNYGGRMMTEGLQVGCGRCRAGGSHIRTPVYRNSCSDGFTPFLKVPKPKKLGLNSPAYATSA